MNKKIGNRFEEEFCNTLAEHGFWVLNVAQGKSGQPADVIAVKDNRPFLIDCKVCSNLKQEFVTTRIEDNQVYAMELWEDSGNGLAWFALKFTETGMVYMVPYIRFKLDEKTRYTEKDMWTLIRERKAKLLKDWIAEA